MRKPCVDTQLACIQPKAGQILIFEHQQLHEGAPVLAGQKYVMRTDVMYCYKPAMQGVTSSQGGYLALELLYYGDSDRYMPDCEKTILEN